MKYPPLGELIPHEGRAVLLDGIEAHSDDVTTCHALIREEMQYVQAGQVDAVLALELMAQTVAVHAGLRGRRTGGRPRAGYVVGVPKMRFEGGDFCVGQFLRIRVRAVLQEAPIGRFEAEVLEAGRVRATGTLTVFEPPVPTREMKP